MPRAPRRLHDPLARAYAAVEQLVTSPLECVARELKGALDTARIAHLRGEMAEDELGRLCGYVSTIVASLPKTYGDRFWFDAGLIRAMSEDWSDQKLFSPIIVPYYETQWGYARLPMPLSEARSDSGMGQSHVVDLICLPREDDLGYVALLDYPWIAHELAHSLMFRYDDLLLPLISPAVTAAVRRRRLAAIADRGRARAASRSALDEFGRFWMPTVDHRNWAHELIADLVAAWVLGPVYLAVFEDLLGHGDQNPYQVSMVHPPYAVRVTTLLKAAHRLRFEEHSQALQRLSDSWGSSRRRSEKTNRYHFLADIEAIDALIDGAFQFCEQLGLRRWANTRISRLTADVGGSGDRGLGTDLLVSAWLVFSRNGREDYARWESETVRAIADSFKP